MNRTGPVEGLMDSVTSDVGLGDRANQMEVNRIPSELECLTYIEELDVFDSSNNRLATVSVNDNVSTVLIR